LAILLLIQLLMLVIIQPAGNFPLNDDWAYAHSAQWLLTEGRVRLSDWISPNLLPQTLLGGGVSWLFGFSFEHLRYLTLIVSILTSFSAFYWYRSVKLLPAQSLVASLVLLAVPCWSVLANSYMSDMYGFIFAIIGATFFYRALEHYSPKWIFVAAVIVCIGVLQRQVVLVIPFAFMVGWYWQQRRWRVNVVFVGIMPLILAMLTQYVYQQYLAIGSGITSAQEHYNSRFLLFFFKLLRGEEGMTQHVASNFLVMTGYLGLFMAPWFVWWGIPSGSRNRLVACLLAVALLGTFTLIVGWYPPYFENNTIDAAGIGPFTLYDALPRELAALERQPGFIWPLAAVVASIGIVAIVILAAASVKRVVQFRAADGQIVFLLTVIVSYATPFLITDFFDRYLLFLVPFLIPLWSKLWPQDRTKRLFGILGYGALSWIATVLIISSMATHDYFAWNQARWEAIRFAEDLGATPETLDGGFEYNGFYRFEESKDERTPGKSFWWVLDDEYIVTFSQVPGYRLIKRFPVNRYSGRTPPQIFLLHRSTTD